MKYILSEFLNGARDKPYRELIQYHIRKQSTSKLQQAVLGEVSFLSEELKTRVMDYIDMTNTKFSCDQDFWIESNCQQAFKKIIETAIDFLHIQDRIPNIQFAYSASTQKAQRKFMGIKKGIFG